MGSSILCLGLQELLAVAYELLAVACEIYFPDQRLNLGCLHWECSLSHCTSREIPLSLLHLNKSLSNCCCCCVVAKVHPTLFDPASQAPLSRGFSRQEYWSGLPFLSAVAPPDPRIKPMPPVLAGGFFTAELPGKPCLSNTQSLFFWASRMFTVGHY